MKKLLIIVLCITAYHMSNAQNFRELATYEFKTAESYGQEEDKVLECANYLFTNPSKGADAERAVSTQYILKWMEGTPDYTFEIGDDAMKITDGSSDLLGLYLAGMTKSVLDNKGEELNNSIIHNKTVRLLTDYCSDKSNKMKPSKALKKIIKGR